MFFKPFRNPFHVQIFDGMYGCVGKSFKPAVTNRILATLGEQIAVTDVYQESHNHGDMRVLFVGDLAQPEFDVLNKEYPSSTRANLLRNVFERDGMVEGLKNFAAHINYSNWAAAVQVCDTLYLMSFGINFYVIDMRKTLGQIFFCPTADDWRAAVAECSERIAAPWQYFPQDQVIIERPEMQMWPLKFDFNGFDDGYKHETRHPDWHIRKFKVTKTKYYEFDTPVGANNDS